MKKTIGLILLLALVAGGYYAYKYYKSGGPQAPEILKIDNVRFSSVQLPPNMGLTFESDVLLKNSNPFSITISRMDFDVYANGKKSTHITQEKNVQLKANSESTMPLKFDIPVNDKDFITGLGDILTGAWKKQAITIRSEGKIFFKVMEAELGVPFEYEDTYPLSDYLE